MSSTPYIAKDRIFQDFLFDFHIVIRRLAMGEPKPLPVLLSLLLVIVSRYVNAEC
jgi:hypothetical protein